MARLQTLFSNLFTLKAGPDPAGRSAGRSGVSLFAAGLILTAAAMAGLSPARSLAAERHCDATYTWETTGGSLKGSFAKFAGRGRCGRAVPNRCRIRARGAVDKCVKIQWEKRWDRAVPDACIENGSDSTVQGYNLTLKCQRLATSPGSECFVNGIQQSETPARATHIETIAGRGDIKARLEGEVCCAFQNGNHRFPNNRDVHVRLSYRTSGDKHCPGGGVLSTDYKINCQQIRRQFCRHQNGWD